MQNDNGQVLSSTVNRTLNYLRSQIAIDQIAVVAKDGTGQYEEVDTAVAAGHKLIYVKAGTYDIDANLDLAGVILFGESPKNTTLQVADNVTISLQGHSAADIHQSGTITFTENSTDVDGTGSTWATGADNPQTYSDPWIATLNYLQDINSVTSDTAASLHQRHEGPNLAGYADYAFLDLLNMGSIISGFTIFDNSDSNTTPLIRISDAMNIIFNNYFKASQTYTTRIIEMAPSTSVACYNLISHNLFISGQTAIYIKDAYRNTIQNNKFQHQSNHCIEYAAATTYLNPRGNRFLHNDMLACGGRALELNTGAHRTIFDHNQIIESNDTAIRVEAAIDDLQITNNRIITDNNECVYFANVACNRTLISDNYIAGDLYLSDCNHLRCQNNHLHSSYLQSHGTHANISNNTLNSCKIEVSATGLHSLVNNNVFIGAQADDAILLNADHGQACNNHIDSPTGRGIQVDGNYCIVHANTIEDAGSTAITVDNGQTQNTITGNNIDSPSGHGIELQANNSRAIIANNNILNTSNKGIHIDDATYCDVHDNIIVTCTETAIDAHVDTAIIQGNQVRNAPRGIEILTDTEAIIDGNLIDTITTDYAIYKPPANGKRLIITNNLINSTTDHAIYILNAGRACVISNNNINNAGDSAIQYDDRFTFGRTIISSNCIHDSSGHGISARDNGGSETNSHLLVISNNDIHDSDSRGINIEGDRTIINANLIYTAVDGIYIAADHCTISNNQTHNCSSDGIDITAAADSSNVIANTSLNNTWNNILDNGTNTQLAHNITA